MGYHEGNKDRKGKVGSRNRARNKKGERKLNVEQMSLLGENGNGESINLTPFMIHTVCRRLRLCPESVKFQLWLL